jgi:hypothetical protein
MHLVGVPVPSIKFQLLIKKKKSVFLTEMGEVGNGCLMETTSGG